MSTITHVISVPLVPADAMAALELRVAIDDLCVADPGLSVAIGSVNEVILRGFSEVQLESWSTC